MKFRAILFLTTGLLILGLKPAVWAANVSWTGGGDGQNWSDSKNWSSGSLPGANDDVAIPAIANNPTIQITSAAGNVQIHSLNSALSVSITNGSLMLASQSVIAGQLSISGASSSLNANAQTTVLANNITVDQGAQVSFPNVTSYAVPAGMYVQWYVQHGGSTLAFPNLTSIAGPTTHDTYFRLVAQYTDQGTGTNASPTLSLPALTAITKADDGDGYANSGVSLEAYNGGVVSAPNLAAFNDNDSHPNSSLTANNGGTLSLPKLLAPKGVNINLNAQSHPEQFTSLAGTANFTVNAGTVTMSNLNTITGFSNITVDQGAQVSFPNVTSYAVPAGMYVQWYVQHGGSTLAFPNLTSIAGPTTHDTYFRLVAQYTDQGTGTNASPTLSLPALTAITKADDGDGYANSGVSLEAYNGGVVSAPNLAAFNDNDSHPNSSLTANNGGTLSLPKLLAPKGVNINLNAQSHPEQFTSLAGTANFTVNAGTVTMSNLNTITGFSNITVDQGAQVSFPNVTSYAVPAGMYVQWYVQHGGSTLAFPNLTSIAGPTTHDTYFRLVAQYTDQGTGTNASPTLSLPALTAITKADDGDGYANSGVSLEAYNGGVVSAPNLAAFNDNDSHPNSSLTANNGGTLSLPKLLAPKGVNINLNAQSHPEQFTSLAGTANFTVNAGTVTMSNLNTITGFSNITVDQGAQVSFPNVTSYAVPAGMYVQWYVQHGGSTLAFPNLTSIAGPTTHDTYFRLVAQYTDQGTGTNASPTLSLPALTAITKADDGDGYANSGVSLEAYNGGVVSAPNLAAFNDNDSHPNSSLTANNGGIVSVPQLMSVVGVSVNFGYALTIAAGQSYVGYGTIQYGVFNSGLIAVNSPGKTLQINGPLSSTGAVKVINGATLSITGDFTLNETAPLTLSATSTLAVTGDFVGTTTNTAGPDPLGTLLLNGGRTSVAPQHLEAMSRDLGAVTAGFTQNFVYGTLALANNTYVQLVDHSRNTTSTTPECVYANSVVVPTGCTLDLNGLHLYARAVQLVGTVLHGTITQIPNAGALALSTPTPGKLSIAGQLDEWTFFFRAGRSVSVFVNPGSSGFAPAISPQLQWANVQLLDANNNVLASGSSATAGSIVSLQNVVVPADGTYKIHVNAPASHTAAIGNYTVGAWDSTPDTRSLTLDQQVAGNIDAAFAVDKWTFSAVAGQQIQFQPTSNTTPGVAFALNGPGGYTAFTDQAGISSLINLPTSGSYSLIAYGLNGATGGYSFVMKQTSVTSLALNTPYHGTWAGSGQAQLFSIPINTVNPLTAFLSDPTNADHTEIYARFGAPPTRETYDYASNGSGSNHGVLVPSAKVGTWYVLVYGESIPSASGNYTLQANASEVVLSSNSTSQGVATSNTVLTLTGAGFNSGTRVSLVAANGTAYAATSSTADLATQITATFAAGSVPAGTYAVQVTQPDGSTATLPSSIIIAATGQGVLQTHINIPNPIGKHIASTLYVTYANTGNAAMPAPLLNVYGTNPAGLQGAFLTLDPSLITPGFWTSATPAGYSHSVQILASGATPGVLQPGETMSVPVYYGGWETDQWNNSSTFNFTVAPVHADDMTPVDWASLEATNKPNYISATAWHIIYANLTSQLGTTAGGYVQLLDKNAIYLGQLGVSVTDISKLWTFAVAQAEGLWPLPTLGNIVDDSLPVAGALPLSFDRTFNQNILGRFQPGPFGLGWFTSWQQSLAIGSDGTVILQLGNGARYIYQPDSRYTGRYFSQAGDHNTFAAVAGGYTLIAANGMITGFNANGTLSYLQDTNGNKINAGYSGVKLVSLSTVSGQSLTFSYNSAGLIATATDSAGWVTTYTYDAANQHLASVSSGGGKTYSYTYDTTSGSPSLNALKSITLPSGVHAYFVYDATGRLAGTSTDGGAEAKALTYSAGQVSITDATGNAFSLFFDQNVQLAKVVDALGNPTFLGHDSNYNMTSVTNAVGATAQFTYNTVGLPTSVTDFLGNTNHFVYGGPQNQLTTLIDAKSNTTQYSYSVTGNLVKTTFANGQQESTTFDPFGNALSYVNAAGEAIQSSHNSAGQLTSSTFPDGSRYAYTYDNRGHMSTATDANGTVNFTYDAATGYLTKVAYPNGTSLSFAYCVCGRRESMVDQSGYATNYFYDAAGRLATLTDGSGKSVVNYIYDANGRLSRKTNGNGTYSTYQYDANGHVLHLINYASSGSVNSRFDDTYNVLGLKTGEVTLDGAWTYSYDGDSQLIHAVFVSNNAATIPNQNLAYQYDGMGNRVSTVANGVTTSYTTNSMNQYSSVGGTQFSYDAKGNLLSDGTSTYVYNYLNKLVSVTSGSSATSYVYNALNQRVSSAVNGQVTEELVDPAGLGNIVGSFGSNGGLIAHYIHGIRLTGQQTPNGAYYYDSDVLGSIVGLSNSAGVYNEKYSYFPFGENQLTSGNIDNPFKYVGAYGVSSTIAAITMMHNRAYNSHVGRFTSEDPIKIAGGINLYTYAQNQPTLLIDPSGLSVASDCDNAFIFVGGGLGLGAGAFAAGVVDFYSLGLGAAFNPYIIGEFGLFGAYLGHLVGDPYCEPPPPNPNPNPDPNPNPNPHPNPNNPSPTPPPTPGGGAGGSGGSTGGAGSTDPNGLYGPSGYGTANFVTSMGNAFAYRVTFENDPKANAPAQTVTIADNLSSSLDWTTFRLTGIGFGDNNLVVPSGSQHYQTTVQMTYNGQTFNVQIETGIHSDTGQVYATFQSIDPNTSLPPSNVLTGFLPPENGTGRGEGYLTYTVSPKASAANAAVIRNVAYITFDGNQPIATNQVDDQDPSKGTDPTKEAPVTIDSTVPTAHIIALPSHDGPNIAVSWSGSDAGGSGIASYTVYVSSDGGQTYAAWLTNTQLTSGVYQGLPGHTYTFYVVATSNVGTVQTGAQAGAVSTYVDYPPQITSATTGSVVMGQSYSYQIVATNSPTSYGATGLPTGLSINASTGLISGVPTKVGIFNVSLSANNLGGTGTAALTLTVSPAPLAPPVITSGQTASAQATVDFSYQITATNMPSVYGASGLPDGLSINTASGLISGTPTTVGTYQVTLSASNSGGTGTATLTLTVTAAPVAFPTITSPATASVVLGSAFSYQITASNNPTSYAATGLPDGLSVSTSTGLISGTPTVTGLFNVNLSAANAGGIGTANLVLMVSPKPIVAPVITSVLATNGQATVPFSYQITAKNGPISFGADGLPDGLSVNTASGLISGTPTTAGIYSITLSATNDGGTGTATLVFTVADALPVVTVAAAIPQVTVGTGTFGEFTLTLSRALPNDLFVYYEVKGSAKNGEDYQLLKGFKKVKAGKTKVNVKVTPLGDLGGASKKVVKFTLESHDGYVVGTATFVKVKILAGQ